MFKKRSIQFIIIIVGFVAVLYTTLAWRIPVTNPDYGISFNTLYARELGLNWKEVYDSLFSELGVKKVRLAAHWNMVEPEDNQFNFRELDYQIQTATRNDVEIILAVGKRLPRWPECHVPEWAWGFDREQEQEEILEYLEVVVNRYKDNSNIKLWQVENEPFLEVFAKDHCRSLNEEFLDSEIELVRKLDPSRKIMVTDTGELGTWRKPYSKGDVFGTTLYLYSWNNILGEFRNPFLPGFYSGRRNLWNLVYGKKEMMIAELSLEPWLDKPVVEETVEVQTKRMSPKKFDNILQFAKNTGIETQYLWGGEWWYYMKLQGEPWYWEKGKEIFLKPKS
jgi:hypothetical protein